MTAFDLTTPNGLKAYYLAAYGTPASLLQSGWNPLNTPLGTTEATMAYAAATGQPLNPDGSGFLYPGRWLPGSNAGAIQAQGLIDSFLQNPTPWAQGGTTLSASLANVYPKTAAPTSSNHGLLLLLLLGGGLLLFATRP